MKSGRLLFTLALGAGLLGALPQAYAQTTVTFWGQSLGPVDRAAIDHIVAAYQEDHPDINVEFVVVSASETDESKLMTAVRGGVGPDVYFLGRFSALERVSQGLLQNLAPFIEDEGVDLQSEYMEFAWKDVTDEEGVYALPFDTDARALYYNKTLLEEAGIDLSLFDPANGPMTPEELNQIAAQLNQKDENGQYTRIGFIPWFEQGWHYTWGDAFNGMFQDGPCTVTPEDPGVIAGMSYLAQSAEDLNYADVTRFINSYYPPNSPTQSHPFFNGQVGMMVSGDWMLAQLAEFGQDADWGITYIPTPDGHVASWSAGWSLAIPSGAKNAQAAYDFARFMTGEEGQRIYVQETSHLPTWQSLLDEDIYDENHEFFKGLLTDTSPLFQLPVGALYWNELTRAQEQVLSGQASVEDAMSEVVGRVQPRLDRACR